MTGKERTPAPGASRREFLQLGGATALTIGALPLLPRPAQATGRARPATGPTPRTGQQTATDPALHVAQRLTYGATPALLAQIEARGPDAFIEEQLDPAAIDDPQVDALRAEFETLHLSSQEIFQNYRQMGGVVVGELTAATILRGVYSQRQLYELVVEFWTNHFNIYIGDGAARYLKTSDDRDVIRAHALGRFADLLRASAQSPAMLFYLDNYLSQAQNPNENYARELLELHTVGVDGGYDEADVLGAARVLTGWTFNRRAGGFVFRAQQHYTGPARVMDWATAGRSGPDAVEDGIGLLDYLARHPSTARHLARKLCVRFVADAPPPGLVESAAQMYLDNDTAIVPVLRHIFASDAFWQSGGQKFRRPHELLVAALRALNAQTSSAAIRREGRRLRPLLGALGQPPFGWHPPNGYPDVAGAWLSTGGLLARWNFVQYALANRLPAFDIDSWALLAEVPSQAGALVDALSQRLLLRPLSGPDRQALLNYLGVAEAESLSRQRLAYVYPQLAALILNATYFQYR